MSGHCSPAPKSHRTGPATPVATFYHFVQILPRAPWDPPPPVAGPVLHTLFLLRTRDPTAPRPITIDLLYVWRIPSDLHRVVCIIWPHMAPFPASALGICAHVMRTHTQVTRQEFASRARAPMVTSRRDTQHTVVTYAGATRKPPGQSPRPHHATWRPHNGVPP